MIISADCHAGLHPAQYREYIEPRYLDDYETWLTSGRTCCDIRKEANRIIDANTAKLREAGALGDAEPPLTNPVDFGKTLASRFPELPEHEREEWAYYSTQGGTSYVTDPDLRIKELVDDGVVAEVIFPQRGIPCGGDHAFSRMHDIFDLDAPEYSPELELAGSRAYHRWLVELTAKHPDRHRGVATIPTLTDVGAAVQELTWAAEHGLKGVLIPPSERGLPPLYHERYEPFWAACVDLDMPVHSHAPAGSPAYGTSGWAALVMNFELFFWVHRPLWILMFGGVIKRFPELKMIFAEQTVGWLPHALQVMDDRYESTPNYGTILPAKPSEMWKRNGFICGTSVRRQEVLLRDEFGTETMMFGTDYPHQEGTWPDTDAYLNTVLRGCSPQEARLICGEVAAKAYGFDLERLRPIADRVGPNIDDVLSETGPLADKAATIPQAARGDSFGPAL